MTARSRTTARSNRSDAQENLLLWSIIVVCTLIEAASIFSDLGILPPPNLRSVIYDFGAFWPGLLRDWAPNFTIQPASMFVTYGFLHAGLLHLSFNMLTLWSLGRIVVGRIGQSGFLVVYGASLIAGAALFGILVDDGSPMVGASGALFGLAGAILLWLWRAQPTVAASLRATWKIYVFLILYNVVVYYALAGGLAWETHLGGFIAGWLVAWIYEARGM